MRLAFVVPAFNVAPCVAEVVRTLVELRGTLEQGQVDVVGIIVVDDGSHDATATLAAASGASVVQHVRNLGKGAALRSGFRAAQARGAEAAVTVDGDGQHPAAGVLKVALSPADPAALVLGVRDMKTVGAPRLHQFSNGISNFFLGMFLGHRLTDSQCGLRRYPVPAILELGVESSGYDFEAEALLRARHSGWPLVEERIVAFYPPPAQRISHYRVARDSFKIVVAVIRTLFQLNIRFGSGGCHGE